MTDDLRVKYLFLNLTQSAYIRLQVAILIGLLIAAVLFFFLGRASDLWFLSNAWWICLIIFAAELLETRFGLYRARRNSASSGS